MSNENKEETASELAAIGKKLDELIFISKAILNCTAKGQLPSTWYGRYMDDFRQAFKKITG